VVGADDVVFSNDTPSICSVGGHNWNGLDCDQETERFGCTIGFPAHRECRERSSPRFHTDSSPCLHVCRNESKLISMCTGDEYEKNGRTVEYKTYSAMMSQIWSLLPGFCTRPTDLSDVSLHIVLCFI